MTAEQKREKKRIAKAEKLEIKKAKQKAIIDAKRAKKRGLPPPGAKKASAEEGDQTAPLCPWTDARLAEMVGLHEKAPTAERPAEEPAAKRARHA